MGRSDGLGTVARGSTNERSELKTWPATARSKRFEPRLWILRRQESGRRCFPRRKAAGVGQPFDSMPIVDCRLPICLVAGTASQSVRLAIGNRQLEMLYVV